MKSVAINARHAHDCVGERACCVLVCILNVPSGADGNSMSHHYPAGSSLRPTDNPDWLGGGGSGSSSSDSKLVVTIDLDDYSDVYRMVSKTRGKAYIINNKNFAKSSGMPRRNGTDVDRDALKDVSEGGFFLYILPAVENADDNIKFVCSGLVKMSHLCRLLCLGLQQVLV